MIRRRLPVSLAFVLASLLHPDAQSATGGLREPAWAPEGRRMAVVYLDRIWTMQPDGRDASELTRSRGLEREPAWSPDGKRIAFAADRGQGFDLFVVSARGGEPQRLTSLDGDERSPSWTPDGRLVFAYRAGDTAQSDLLVIDTASGAGEAVPLRLTQSFDDEVQPRVSPDGRRIAFASNRASDDGDYDLWLMRLLDRTADPADGGRGAAVRFARTPGRDGYPAWSPDGLRLAYYGVRDGVGATWVADVPSLSGPSALADADRPFSPVVLASRRGGTLAWSPDGQSIAIGAIVEPEPGYNGEPRRDVADGPPLFDLTGAHQLWTVLAPRVVDDGRRAVSPSSPVPQASLARAFDTVWDTLRRLYYTEGPSARAWDTLRDRYRPRAQQARTPAVLEDIIDSMVAAQPLAKPAVSSTGAIVVSAHPLASAAGRLILERGGNVVDAAIAVSFALGVVEPDASGIGGDGQAMLYLAGMAEPTVIEFKDQTPAAASLTNPRVFRGGRLVSEGPASANVPGVVAGMAYLHERYGSGRVSWAELLSPAIRYAEDGFVLDETLPSSVAEGRAFFQRYPASARIFLPDGRPPRPGMRFVNSDYAATLRVLATEGPDAFYRGSVARRIAADMEANGGMITYDDLAQYRAIERKPVSGVYRDRVLYTGGPPVGSGVSLLEALQVLANYQPRPGVTVATDADYLHYVIESWKARDRITRIADPAQWPVDFAEHLLPRHAEELFERIERSRANRFPDDSEEVLGGLERIGSGTSGFVIADVDGNTIAATQTLSTWGGSFYVSRGLGFLYNNHLRAARTMPGVYGQLLPRTRSNTSNIPIIGFRGGAPAFALAAAGNAWIPASTYSIVTALVDGGLTMQQAIEAPRFLITRDPADADGSAARVEIEDRFPHAILQDLMVRGHRFQKIGRKGEMRYGYASGVTIDIARGLVEGGADPRRSHAAVAVERGRVTTQ